MMTTQHSLRWIWAAIVTAVVSLPCFAASSPLDGDLNADGVVDIDDLNLMCNILVGHQPAGTADLNGDGTVDIDDVNALINTILHRQQPASAKGWLTVEPDTIVDGMMINASGRLCAFANARLLVWPVQSGDTLRLSIDHDNHIGVNMRSFSIFGSADSSTWKPESALATGCNLKAVDGLKVYDPIVVPEGAKVLVCSGYWYPNGRVGDGGSAALNPFTAYRLERWVDARLIPARRQLRMLAVGNSFTCDDLSYVPYVMQSLAPDVDLHLRLLIRPNAPLTEWVRALDSVSPGRYYDWQPFPGRWTTPADGLLHEQVAADHWDVITLQQASFLPFWDEVEAPLRTLTTWLRDSMGYQGRIDWVMNHAYSDSNVCVTPELRGLRTSDEMWQAGVLLAQQVAASGLVDRVLPCGTAVQNARHTRLRHFARNQLCAGSWAPGKTGDRHLQEGIGPFISACAATGKLLNLSPLDARVQLSSTWRIPAANPSYTNAGIDPTLDQIDKQKGGLGMDPDSQALGAWCAEQALQQPYELIDDQPE